MTTPLHDIARPLTRLRDTLLAFEPRQLAWRALFVAERRGAALVAPWLERLTAPRHAPVVVDAGRAMRWRRRLESADAAWLEALLDGWLLVHGHARALPLEPRAPHFWLEPPARHPDARHVLIELQCHAFAPWLACLTRVGAVPLAESASALLRWMWESWVESVRFEAAQLGGAWHPWPVARRALHWLEAIDWLQDRSLPGEVASDEAWPALEAARLLPGVWAELERSARYLHLHTERDVRGNHLLTDGVALMALGLAFAHERWFRAGARIWTRDLPVQLMADGVHYERSPMYHAEVLGMVLDALALFDRAERVFGPGGDRRLQLQHHARRMLDALERLAHPDDGIALLGDSALGVAPGCSTLRQRARELGVGAQTGTRRVRRSPSGLVRLERRAGLERPSQVVVLDAAPFGPRTLPAHGHCDAGSFEYSVGRERLVVDGGTFCYDAGPMRDYFRGSRGHNGLYVPGREQSEIWGSFRVARRARVTHRVTDGASGHATRAELVVRGYFGAAAPRIALCWRRTLQLAEHGLELLDALDEPPPPGTRLQLRLAPGTELVEQHATRLVLRTGERRWVLEGAVHAVRVGWYAPRFGERLHVPLVELAPPEPGHPSLTRLLV